MIFKNGFPVSLQEDNDISSMNLAVNFRFSNLHLTYGGKAKRPQMVHNYRDLSSIDNTTLKPDELFFVG